MAEIDAATIEQTYMEIMRSKFLPYGTRMLRGGSRTYSPCVLDNSKWADFFLTYPKDYDIRNDPVFNLHRSTYTRLMDAGADIPEPTTSEMTRTGYCGPDQSSLTQPVFLRCRENDRRPEPAYRLHLSDRTALHHLRADPLEGVIPFGRQGDMTNAKSVSKRDFKWRQCCPTREAPPPIATLDRKVHHNARTDIHGRFINEVVKFDDDCPQKYFNQKLIKLKKAWHWPINPLTGESLGGNLLYYCNDPCTESRHKIWPCGEKDKMDCNPICIPDDRCCVLAHRPKEWNRLRQPNFHQKSYLDMRYPIRNYECWEEVPACCGPRFQDFPRECKFDKAWAEFPCRDNQKTCPQK